MHPTHWGKTKITDPQNGVGFTERQMLSAASLAAVGTVMMSATSADLRAVVQNGKRSRKA
jgi:hypothetical protein